LFKVISFTAKVYMYICICWLCDCLYCFKLHMTIMRIQK